MKKFFLGILSIAILMLSTSTFAIDGKDRKKDFYLRMNAGVNKINDIKEKIEDTNKSVKAKSQISPVFIIGFGGYINNTIRSDVTFEYLKAGFEDCKLGIKEIVEEGARVSGDYIADREAYIYSGMFNTYVDLPVNDQVNFFIGGGIGLAQIKEKISRGVITAKKVYNNEGDSANHYIEDYFASSKKKNNFAYTLIAGTSVKIWDNNITFEMAYNWKNFGKTKYKKEDSQSASRRYSGHILTVGVRFDI